MLFSSLMEMRRLSFTGSLLGALLIASSPTIAHAQNAGASGNSVKPSSSSKQFGSMTDLSLDTREAAPSLIGHNQSAAHEEVVQVRAKSRFSDAPLPDDDIEAPAQNTDDGATLRPDFFRQDQHMVGDALDNGAHANTQRAGHGNFAAGVAVAVPMD